MVKIPSQLQKRLKNDPKISNFLKFSNDLENVCRHSGGHYNINIKHFEHFSGGGGSWSPPSCQVGLRKEKMHLFHSRSPHTIKVYSKVIKRYVKVLRRISNKSYPVGRFSLSVLSESMKYYKAHVRSSGLTKADVCIVSSSSPLTL